MEAAVAITKKKKNVFIILVFFILVKHAKLTKALPDIIKIGKWQIDASNIQGRRKSGASGALAPQILAIFHYYALHGSNFGCF